jgi:hypothetical protein
VAATIAACPRCKARDGVTASLHFKIFEPSAIQVASLKPPGSKPASKDRAAT